MSEEYIGVDVGGTKIAVASLRDGELTEPRATPTSTEDADALLDAIVAAVEEARSDAAVAVGIGVPSVIDYETGTARSSVNVPLENVPLRDVLGERLGLPTFVDNDATLAALAEAHEGDQLVVRDLVMFTVGTGVGGGLVLNGEPYRGASGAAGELGHTLIALEAGGAVPAPSRFPQVGSLESLAAGRVLDRLAVAAASEHPESALGRAAGDEEVTGAEALAAARDGDEVAIGLIERLGGWLGVGVANAINAFDPEVVAIGGGVSAAGDLLLEPVRRVASEYVLPGVGTRTKIRLSQHGYAAGVLGAALMAKRESQRRKEAG